MIERKSKCNPFFIYPTISGCDSNFTRWIYRQAGGIGEMLYIYQTNVITRVTQPLQQHTRQLDL